MILLQCVTAYVAVQKLMEQDMDFESAHAIMTLKRKLEHHAMFYAERERDLIMEYAVLGENGDIKLNPNGTFNFRDPERKPEYDRLRRELGSVGVELEGAGGIRLKPRFDVTPAQLEALDGLVEWESP